MKFQKSPMRAILPILLCVALPVFAQDPEEKAKTERPLRIIAFGAHPDDVEFRLSGCAAKWVALGHKVKFVSVTNGDIGHWKESGGALAIRRVAEVEESAKRLGIEVEVLDVHDGEIMPDLATRKVIARLIREWDADVVITHRPYDYHPDHRNAGLLVRDAAFMIRVPFYVPDTPPIKHSTTFLYFYDRFTTPYPFKADVAVAIDDVFDKKIHAIDALATQVYEGGALGSENTLMQRFASDPDRRKGFLKKSWQNRDGNIANKFRESLIKWYGEEKGKAVKYAEVFEVCEYGHRPSEAELKRLFPFFD